MVANVPKKLVLQICAVLNRKYNKETYIYEIDKAAKYNSFIVSSFYNLRKLQEYMDEEYAADFCTKINTGII